MKEILKLNKSGLENLLSFENRFDLVFSNTVLHWVKNHKPVIKGLYKSLNVGGKILLIYTQVARFSTKIDILPID